MSPTMITGSTLVGQRIQRERYNLCRIKFMICKTYLQGQVEIFFQQYSSTSRKLICDFYILIVLFFITVYKYI